tara:strand:- start:341 stop:529 length:189 start_codon:yes stop_codon:yes gene_type:complete
MQKPDFKFQKSMSAAYTLLGSILALGGIGYYFYIKYDNIIWFLSFLFVGIVVGMYELYKQMK